MPEVLREGGRPKKLLTLVREAIRRRHMSGRTEQSYVSWIKRYIYFHGKRHPATMGEPEVEAFPTHLAVEQGRRIDQESSFGRVETCSESEMLSQPREVGLRSRI